MNNIVKLVTRIFILLALTGMTLPSSIADEKEKLIGFINDTASQVMSVIKSANTNSQKEQKLCDIFCKSVDITWMAKFSLGKFYKKINKSELEKYLVAYKDFMLNTYVSKFSEYNGVDFYIESVKYISNSEYIVNTKILNEKYTLKYINIAYRIKMMDRDFFIRDIIVEGISLILGQRSDFNSIIEKDGIISLIQKLEDKIQ